MKNILTGLILIMLSNNIMNGQSHVDFKKHIDNEKKISINYPSDWTEMKNNGVTLLYVRPSEPSDTYFRENFNLTISGKSGYKTLEEIVKYTTEQLGLYLKEYKLEKSEKFQGNGITFIKTTYFHATGGNPIKVYLYQALKGELVYNITCSTTPSSYKHYSEIFDEIVKSFEAK